MPVIKKTMPVILLAQLASAVSFAVLYSTLVLYLTHSYNYSSHNAYSIFGVFLAYNFGLQFVGGYLGGRLASYRTFFAVACVLQAIACVILSTANSHMLYIGLSLFLVGQVFTIPCLSMIITQNCTNQDALRERMFYFNYAAMNIGFVIAYTMSGYFQLNHAFSWLFIATSFFNLAALALFIMGWQAVADKTTPLIQAMHANGYRTLVKRHLLAALSLMMIFAVVYLSITHPFSTNYLIVGISILVFLALAAAANKQKSAMTQHKLWAYLVLVFFGLIFWSIYYLLPTGLTIFVAYHVDLNFFGIKLAPQWLGNINTIIIVIGGFALPALFKKIRHFTPLTIPALFAGGLFTMGLAFLVLVASIILAQNDGIISIYWVIASYCLLSIGELLVAPVGYAMIGKLAPAKLQGLLMGSWLLFTGSTASEIASALASTVKDPAGSSPLVSEPMYMQLFALMALVALLGSGMLYLLKPWLIKLINSKSKPAPSQDKISSSLGGLLLLNYSCMALFSGVVGMFFILPIYYHKLLGYSAVAATTLASMFIVGRLLGLCFSNFAFNGLKASLQKNHPNICIERLMLAATGLVIVVVLLLLASTTNYYYTAGLLFVFGFFASLIIPLNTSILNSLTYNLNKTKHASLQRIAQNAGLAVMFLVFVFADKIWQWDAGAFRLLAIVLLFVSLLELMQVKHLLKPIDIESTPPPSISSSHIMFHLVFFLSSILFLQFANLYAYFISHQYGVDEVKFAELMLLNVVLTIIFQYFIFVRKQGAFADHTKALFALGIALIGIGMYIPLWRSGLAAPLLSVDWSVVISFVVVTLGEVLFFTGSLALLMSFATSTNAQRTKNSFMYYLNYYIAGVTAPLVVFVLGYFASFATSFTLVLAASIALALFTYFRL